MKKHIWENIVSILCLVLFIGGISLGLFGRAICVRNTQNYQELQPELFAPDEIATALYHEDAKQIYICYNDASYVNVYTESGQFLWAVSTPYLRNAYFELEEDKLIIYNDEAYIYNALDGSFIDCENADTLEYLDYNWEEPEGTDEHQAGELYYDTYQVYIAQTGGTLKPIVARPWWYWLFNFGVDWCIAFSGAALFGILMFLEKRKDWKSVKKGLLIKDKEVAFILKYYKITAIVQGVYAILNILLSVFGGFLILGIIPLALHIIISSAILDNRLGKYMLASDEESAFSYWNLMRIITFVIAFFSVIIVSMMIG